MRLSLMKILNEYRIFIDLAVMMGGIITVYVKMNARLSTIENDIKWIKQLFVNTTKHKG